MSFGHLRLYFAYFCFYFGEIPMYFGHLRLYFGIILMKRRGKIIVFTKYRHFVTSA